MILWTHKDFVFKERRKNHIELNKYRNFDFTNFKLLFCFVFGLTYTG